MSEILFGFVTSIGCSALDRSVRHDATPVATVWPVVHPHAIVRLTFSYILVHVLPVSGVLNEIHGLQTLAS